MFIDDNGKNLCVYDIANGKEVCLTPKELDVLSCLMARKSNKRIALLFGCSHRTIEVHVSKILYKFSLNSREEVYELIKNCGKEDFLKKHYKTLVGINDSSNDKCKQKNNINKKHLFYKRFLIYFKKYKFQYLLSFGIFLFVSFFATQSALFSNDNNKLEKIHPDLPTPPSSIFLEREKLNDQIYDFYKKYDGVPIIALLGVAGSGKTVLARSFAKKRKSQIIWEVNAESEETILNSFEDLAYVLAKTEEELEEILSLKRINIRSKKNKLLIFVKRKLEEAENWIIIYDNLVDISSLESFFPALASSIGKGTILITTQNSNIKQLIPLKNSSIIYIDRISEDEKNILFRKIVKENISLNAEDLALFIKKIPPYPMDIIVAASSLISSQLLCDEYLARIYSKKKKDYIPKTKDYILNVRYQVVDEGLSCVVLTNERIERFLKFLSLMDCDNISKDFLVSYEEEGFVSEVLNRLNSYSLITMDQIYGEKNYITFSLNKYAKDILRLKRLKNPKENQEILEAMVNKLEEYIKSALNEENYLKIRDMISTVDSLLKRKNNLSQLQTERLYFLFGRMKDFLGSYKEALLAYQNCYSLNLERKNKNNIDTAKIFIELGNTQKRLEKFEEAEKSYERGIELFKKNYGDQYDQVASIMSSLANTYKARGDYKKAETYFLNALKIYDLHKNQAKVAFLKARIGNLYSHIGDYKKGLPFLEDSLVLYEEIFGAEDIKTSWVQVNLAYVYVEIGLNEKAKTLLEKSLRLRIKHYGKDHPKTGWVLANYARLYKNIADFDKAESYTKKALDVFKKTLGSTHNLSLRVLGYQCELEIDSHKIDGMELKLDDLYEKFSSLYGKHHTKTGWVLYLKGKLMIEKGNHAKAMEYLKASYENYKSHNHVDAYRVQETIGDQINEKNDRKNRYENSLGWLNKYYPSQSPKIKILNDKITNL